MQEPRATLTPFRRSLVNTRYLARKAEFSFEALVLTDGIPPKPPAFVLCCPRRGRILRKCSLYPYPRRKEVCCTFKNVAVSHSDRPSYPPCRVGAKQQESYFACLETSSDGSKLVKTDRFME